MHINISNLKSTNGRMGVSTNETLKWYTYVYCDGGRDLN